MNEPAGGRINQKPLFGQFGFVWTGWLYMNKVASSDSVDLDRPSGCDQTGRPWTILLTRFLSPMNPLADMPLVYHKLMDWEQYRAPHLRFSERPSIGVCIRFNAAKFLTDAIVGFLCHPRRGA